MITFGLNDSLDLEIDSEGNFATKEGQEQIAQDVSTSVKMYRGEYVFDVNRGVPYENILGERLNQSLIQEYMNIEAKRINDVLNTTVIFNELDNSRTLDYDILISTTNGVIEGL